MKIIGIDGNIGAGKTTISRYILKNTKRKVIHLDRLLMNTKKKYFKNSIKILTNQSGEVEVFFDSKSLAKKILDLKYVRYLFTEYKKNYIKGMMKYLIEKYQNDLDYLIIEGCGLNKYDLDNYFNYLIFAEADTDIRYERFTKRENIDEKSKDTDINIRKTNNFNIQKVDKYPHDFVFTINNNGNKKELKDKINNIEDYIMVLK